MSSAILLEEICGLGETRHRTVSHALLDACPYSITDDNDDDKWRPRPHASC